MNNKQEQAKFCLAAGNI